MKYNIETSIIGQVREATSCRGSILRFFCRFRIQKPNSVSNSVPNLVEQEQNDDLYQHQQVSSLNHSSFQTKTHSVKSLHLSSADINADIHVFGVAVVPRNATDLLREQNARIDQVSRPDFYFGLNPPSQSVCACCKTAVVGRLQV